MALPTVANPLPWWLAARSCSLRRCIDGWRPRPGFTPRTRLSRGSIFGAMRLATNCPARPRPNLVLARERSVLRRSGSTKRSGMR